MFIGVYRLKNLQAIKLYSADTVSHVGILTQLCELLPLLELLPCWGVWGSGPQTDKHLPRDDILLSFYDSYLSMLMTKSLL